uniref:Zinc metalloproteinase n=1 Tax=Strongyloides venezuelensis TaxID=75913 RepID=A0A0K0EVV3_STRVS
MNSVLKIFLFFQCISQITSKNEGKLKADGNSESYETRVKKSIITFMKLKWTFPIDYSIRNGVDRRTIKAALAAIEKETCIRFRETDRFTNGGLMYVNKSVGCFSFIGKVSKSKPQNINLGGGCNKLMIAIHETLHALGLIHEMSRHDRDSYIKLKYENMGNNSMFNFMLFDLSAATPYGLKYDYGSVMQYDRVSGTLDGRITTVPKYRNYLKTIGQKTRFGFNDAKQLNIHYCSDKCRDSKLKCKMGGYPDPNKKCIVCKCPPFYEGKLCTKLSPSDEKCGITKLKATNTEKLLIVKGIKTCYIQITAPRRRKVLMNILETNFRDSFVCQPNKGLEVKFFTDKTVSGSMFCGKNFRKIVKSQNNVVVMKYVGLIPSNRIRIRYHFV